MKFISTAWFETLSTAGVDFVIRIRKNALVTRRSRTRSAGQWLEGLAPGELQRRKQRVWVYGHPVFLTSLRRTPEEGDVSE